MTLIWFPVCFLLSTFISHFVRGLIFFFSFFLLHLLHLCDKVSHVCLSFDEWVLKVFLLESQTTVLFESVLSEIPFWDPAVLFEFGFKWTQERLGYLCEWLTDFLLAFSEPFTVKILHFRGLKTSSVWYAYKVCMPSRNYMFGKYTCITESMSLLGSKTRKMKRENGHKVMDLSNLGSSLGISLFAEGSPLSIGYKSEAEL